MEFRLHESYLEGRNPPAFPLFSQDSNEWHNEQLRRCFEGYQYPGYPRITGDYYNFLNFTFMPRALLDEQGNATDNFVFSRPFISQDDDYLFKQIEEADQDRLIVMLMTGRGFGKTFIINSIGQKIFLWYPKGGHNITSASSDSHANPTWKKLQAGLREFNSEYPAFYTELLLDSEYEMQSGRVTWDENNIRHVSEENYWEKIVYGGSSMASGKIKGRRVDFHHFEEIGDWSIVKAASLKKVMGAAKGIWRVGGLSRARVFMTGTGGSILSDQAKEIFYKPLANGLYVPKERKTPGAIFVRSTKKYGSTWEATGVSDEAVAEKLIQAERARLEIEDPEQFEIFCQEFPLTEEEMFAKKGGYTFDKIKLGQAKARLVNDSGQQQEGDPILKPKWGFMFPVKLNGQVVGAEFRENPKGKVWVIEPPELHEGQPIPDLYVGGLDGIAMGGEDTASGKGSLGALTIKKRINPYKRMGRNNLYCAGYADRPDDLDVCHEQMWLLMMWYTARVNIEFSANGNAIIPYLVSKKQDFRLMKRPPLTWGDGTGEVESKLIGTLPTVKNISYGVRFLRNYIRDHWDLLFVLVIIDQLLDFTLEDRTKFDWVMSMIMCELGDDALAIPEKKDPPVPQPEWGYYYDEQGNVRVGLIPQKNPKTDIFKGNADFAALVKDIMTGY